MSAGELFSTSETFASVSSSNPTTKLPEGVKCKHFTMSERSRARRAAVQASQRSKRANWLNRSRGVVQEQPIAHLTMSIADKWPRLQELFETTLADSGSVLILTNHRAKCEALTRSLNRHGIASVSLHGGISRRLRQLHARALETGKVRVLVSTRYAVTKARVQADTVIHYDVPTAVSILAQDLNDQDKGTQSTLVFHSLESGGGQ